MALIFYNVRATIESPGAKNCNLIVAKNKSRGGFCAVKNGKMSEFFLGVVDIAKHLFGSHIPEETDEGFQFVCAFIRVCFSFIFRNAEQIGSFQAEPRDHTMLISIMSYILEFMMFSSIRYQLHQCPKSGQP